jgi:ABC-type multidrug transport system fused ATPase/permease subunit
LLQSFASGQRSNAEHRSKQKIRAVTQIIPGGSHQRRADGVAERGVARVAAEPFAKCPGKDQNEGDCRYRRTQDRAREGVPHLGGNDIAPVCADFCAALVILATVEWHLVIALYLFMLLGVAAPSLLGRRRHVASPRLCRPRAEVAGTLVDIVANIWVVKSFSAHSRERGPLA